MRAAVINKKTQGIALLDVLVTIIVIVLTTALLFSKFAKDRRYLYYISCNCNLSQMGKGLIQYESPSYFNTGPEAYNDININQKNIIAGSRMYLLFHSGLMDNPRMFHCPFGREYYPEAIQTPDFTRKKAWPLSELKTMYQYTDYGLINGYRKKLPGNTIICSDSPFSESERSFSIHGPPEGIFSGTNCLYADGHSKAERSLTPPNSSLGTYSNTQNTIFSPKGGDYQVDACGIGTKSKQVPLTRQAVETLKIIVILTSSLLLLAIYFGISLIIKKKRGKTNTS